MTTFWISNGKAIVLEMDYCPMCGDKWCINYCQKCGYNPNAKVSKA